MLNPVTQPNELDMLHPQSEQSAVEIKLEVFHRLDYCQELLPGGAVILLGGGEGFAIIGDDYLPTLLDLQQYGANSVVAGISFQDIFPCGIGVGQDRCSEQATLEAVECLLFSWGPLSLEPLCGELNKRLRYSRKVWYVLSVVPYQAQKFPEPSQVLRRDLGFHCLYLVRVCRHTITAHSVTQVHNLWL